MAKTTGTKIPAIIVLAAILSLSIFASTTYADDTQKNSDTDKATTKEKHHDKGLPPPPPGVPIVRSDKKHHDNNDGGVLPPPGVPIIQNDDNGGGSYNSNNIKKFDTSKSIFNSSDSHSSKIIEYMPGFNDTFYNSTLPYCFAVTTGACYDNMNNRVLP
jgi:hypothetical protein